MKKLFHAVFVSLIFMTLSASAQPSDGVLRFDFGTSRTQPGYVAVDENTLYTPESGYGLEQKSSGREGSGKVLSVSRKTGSDLTGDFLTSDGMFLFSVRLPQGNYKVRVILGDMEGESKTSVRAEQRRLMVEGVSLSGGVKTVEFGVNVRNHSLSPGNSIKFDSREWDYERNLALMNTWDDKLTLAFCDEKPCVCAVEIEKAEDPIIVYLLGDSTVTDQAGDYYATWGQVLPRWFRLPVIVANHAESGQTAKAFRFQRRWDKVVESLKPGDYVIMQFGTNDAKDSGHDAMWPEEDKAGEWAFTHVDALTDYVWQLASYAVEVKRYGATPVIVSPMTKIDYRSGAVNSAPLGDYPEGAKRAAELADCLYIDLFDMSIDIVEALGEKAPLAFADGTHSGNYGAYLFSRCMAKGLKESGIPLADWLLDEAWDFNPSAPAPSVEEYNHHADGAFPGLWYLP